MWLTAFLGAVSIIAWAAARTQLAIPAWMVVVGAVLLGSGLAIGGISRFGLRRLQAKHARFLAEGLADLNRLGRLENRFFLAVSWLLAGVLLSLAGLLSLVFSGLPVSALPVALGLGAATLLMAGALSQASDTRAAVLALIAPGSDKAVDSHDALRRLTPRFHADRANRMAFAGGKATEDARKLAAIADHPGAFWPRIDVLPGHSVFSRLAALAVGVAGLWRKLAAAGILAWVLAALLPFPALPPLPSPLAVWNDLTTPPETEEDGAEDDAPADDEEATDSDPSEGESGSDAGGTDADQGSGEESGNDPQEASGSDGGSGQDDGAEGQSGEGQAEAPGEPSADTGEPGDEPGEGPADAPSEAGSEGDSGEASPTAGDAGTGNGPQEAPGSADGSGQDDGAEGQEQSGEGSPEAPGETEEGEANPQSEAGSEAERGDAGSSESGDGSVEAPGLTGGSAQDGGEPSADSSGEPEGRAPGGGAEGESVEQPGEGQPEAPGGRGAEPGAEDSGPASSGESLGESPEPPAGSGTGGQDEASQDAGGPTEAAGATGGQEAGDPPRDGTVTRAEATDSGAAGERVEADVPGETLGDPVDEPPGLEVLVRPDAPSAASETIDMTLQATGWAGETDTPAETRPDVQGFAAPGGMAQTLVATPPSADLPDIGTPRTQQSPEQPIPTWIRNLFGP